MTLKGPHFIIGLGNPGSEYENTRHNAGFKIVNELARELNMNYWKLAANALVGEANYQGERIVLVKPQSFMNLSGGPVKGLAGRYKFGTDDILVIHDELDLPAGALRLKVGGGHAGHNGLRSLHQSIGQNFARLRIGIGRPPGRMPARVFVLEQLRPGELEDFEITVKSAVPIVLKTVEEGVAKAMNEFHRDNNEPSMKREEAADTMKRNSTVIAAKEDTGIQDIVNNILENVGHNDGV